MPIWPILSLTNLLSAVGHNACKTALLNSNCQLPLLPPITIFQIHNITCCICSSYVSAHIAYVPSTPSGTVAEHFRTQGTLKYLKLTWRLKATQPLWWPDLSVRILGPKFRRHQSPSSSTGRGFTHTNRKQWFFLITNLTHFFQCIYLFPFSTCFEQPSAHHQENQILSIHRLVYITLCRWLSGIPVRRGKRAIMNICNTSRGYVVCLLI